MKTATPSLTVSTTTGTVAAGAASVTFTNTHASADATVAGGVLGSGQSVTWSVLNSGERYGAQLGAIAYDATSSELTISVLRVA